MIHSLIGVTTVSQINESANTVTEITISHLKLLSLSISFLKSDGNLLSLSLKILLISKAINSTDKKNSPAMIP